MSETYTLIGLTGPTGSGKTTVAEVFRNLGFAVVNADEIAHKALEDKELIKALAGAFGEGIINSDGSVNRRETAKIAFASKDNTETLNSLTHPVILRLAQSEFERLYDEGYKKIIFDAPTLFESGSHILCRKIISVVAPKDIRIKRITARDGITEEEAKRRVGAQKPNGFYIENSDYVLYNSGTSEALSEKAETLAKELMNE